MAAGDVTFPIDRVHLEITNACNAAVAFVPLHLGVRHATALEF